MTDTAAPLHPISAHRTITVPAFPKGTREIRELAEGFDYIYGHEARTGSMLSIRTTVAAIAAKIGRKIPGLTIHLFADDMGPSEWCLAHREFGTRHPEEQARSGVACVVTPEHRTDITVAATGVPVFDGTWTPFGSLSMDSNDVVTAKTYGRPADGEDTASRYRELAGQCAHCGVKRRRAVTVLLRNPAGDVRPVGRSCLGDYTAGSIRAEVVAELLALGERMQTAFGVVDAAEPDSAPTLDVVAVALLLVERFGFVRSGDETTKIESTRTRLRKCIAPMTGEHSDVIPAELTDADRAAARTAMDDVLADTSTNDYVANMQAVVAAEWCQINGVGSKLGLLASLPGMATRAREAAQRRAIRNAEIDALPNGFIGRRDEKITITGHVSDTKWVDNGYNGSLLVKVETTEGLVKMFTTARGFDDLTAGDPVEITGTVKSYDQYNGRNETLLARPKLISAPAAVVPTRV